MKGAKIKSKKILYWISMQYGVCWYAECKVHDTVWVITITLNFSVFFYCGNQEEGLRKWSLRWMRRKRKPKDPYEKGLMLSVVGMNLLVYYVKGSFVLVMLRRFDNQRCVKLIEHKTLDKVKRYRVTEGNGGTQSFYFYIACVHTHSCPPTYSQGWGGKRILGPPNSYSFFFLLHFYSFVIQNMKLRQG